MTGSKPEDTDQDQKKDGGKGGHLEDISASGNPEVTAAEKLKKCDTYATGSIFSASGADQVDLTALGQCYTFTSYIDFYSGMSFVGKLMTDVTFYNLRRQKSDRVFNPRGRSNITIEFADECSSFMAGRSGCRTDLVSRKDREARHPSSDGPGTRFRGKNRGLKGVWEPCA